MRVLAILIALLFLPLAAADHTLVQEDPAAHLFPDPQEVQDAIDAMQGVPGVTIHEVGASKDKTPLTIVEVTHPDSTVPMHERVVTYIMTQQHGNEPAGTPAAIQLLEELRTDQWLPYLENQILLILPQSNPDGALDGRRTNEDGTDINRDHVHLTTPEAQAIHKALLQWDVHIALDHHEYGGIGAGYPSPVQVYDFDVTTMYANHGNVREPVRKMSLELNYDHLKPYLEERGYTHGDYGTYTVTAGPVSQPIQQVAGGPDPGILRNNYGLNNVAGLLVESYVAPGENPLHSFERRVGAHKVTMDAVIQWASDNAERVIEAKREAERLNREEPMSHYQEGEPAGSIPEAFHVSKDLSDVFALHGLPAGIAQDGGHVHNLDHNRAGLVLAMLHPDSSRHIVAGHAADAAALDGTALQHRDYLADPHAVPEPVLQSEPANEETPGIPLLAIMALLAIVVLARRR